VAEWGDGPNNAMALKATALLRGLAHRRDYFGDLGVITENFLAQIQSAALKARRHEILRAPAESVTGSLVASRCVSLDAIMRIGRSADNCLAESGDYWTDFVSGTRDIWAFREDARLVAILAVSRSLNEVLEVRGPRNRKIAFRHIRDLALFCRERNFTIWESCEGLLAEFAECPVLGPKVIVFDDCVVEYAEWSNAVRVDWSSAVETSVADENDEIWFKKPQAVLTLAFDPASSCAREILDGRDFGKAITAFGEATLRKIVKTIAMDQATPSLVQHRLLALTACDPPPELKGLRYLCTEPE